MFNQTPPSEDNFSVNNDPTVDTPSGVDLDSLNKDKNFPFKKVGSSTPVSEDIFSTTDKQKEYQIQKPMAPRVNTDISNPQVNTMPRVDKYLKKNSQPNAKATSGNKAGFKKIATIFLIILILAGVGLAGFWAYGKFFKSKPVENLPEDTSLNDVLKDLNENLQQEAQNPVEEDNTIPNPEDVVEIEVKDTDGDKLLDPEEETIGTNPNKVDTDFDGLSDYDEVKVYLTNPVKADSDNDGYVDGLEVQNGYDPLGPGKLNLKDETANWQTYTNSEYEIKYPQGWKFKKTSDSITHFGTNEEFSGIYQTPSNSIQIFQTTSDLPNNEQNLTFNEWLDYQIKQDLLRNKKGIIIGGINGYEFLESGMINYRSIWIEKAGHFYKIVIDADHAKMETVDQILSTFKFTK